MKKNEGVTLTALILTIIVMFIILGVTISTTTDVLRNSQKNRLKTNLYMVQAKAAVLLEDYMFDGSATLGTSVDTTLYITIGFAAKEDGTSTYVYYIWDEVMLESQGIDADVISGTETFIVQYNLTEGTVDVGSTKGFKDSDGTAYYILSDL